MNEDSSEIVVDAEPSPGANENDDGSTAQPSPSTPDETVLDEHAAALPADSREVVELIGRVRSRDPGLFADSGEVSESGSTTPATIGRFEIVRELGRGGFGVVMLARDPHLDRLVALKVPHPEVVLSPQLSERFLREGRAAAALKHPGIVPVYEAAMVGPISYLVSEYCDGPTLAAWLHNQAEPVDPRLAGRLVRDMALAVQHAHERGIVHRDLKPGNVLLRTDSGGPDSELDPLITDFGMARVVEDSADVTMTGAALGTPAYMAPEQAAGRRNAVGPATDVYALGVILYEMLTGRRPFEGETTLATLHAIQHETLKPPAERVASVPADLNAVCLKCLERNPDARHPTAGALAEGLDDFLADAQPPTESSRRPTRRAFATAAMAGVAVVVGFIATSAWRRGDDTRPTEPSAISESPAESSDGDSPPSSPDRRVATWIIEHGGHVSIAGGLSVRSISEIPDGPFTLSMVNVAYMETIDPSRFEDLLALRDCGMFMFAIVPLDDAQLERLARPGITSLRLDQTAVTNQGLRHIAGFADITALHVTGHQYTDELFQFTGDWPALTSLSLMSIHLTNDGLRYISEMTSLTDLSLRDMTNNSAFDDAGLQWISRLSGLKSLDLRGTRVTDAGVLALKAQLPECGIRWDSEDQDIRAALAVLGGPGTLRLAVDGHTMPAGSPADFPAQPFTVREIDLHASTLITDEVLELIRQLRELETLHLPAIDHSESSLSVLTEVTSLKRLVLHDVTLDEATIAELCRLRQLEILEIHGGELTSGQRADVEAGLPECRVVVTGT